MEGASYEQVRAQMCNDFQEVLRRVLAPVTDQLESAARSLRRSQRHQEPDFLGSDLCTDLREAVARTIEPALLEQAERTKRQQLLLMQVLEQQTGMRDQLGALLEAHASSSLRPLPPQDGGSLVDSQVNSSQLNCCELNGSWDAVPEDAVKVCGTASPPPKDAEGASQPLTLAPLEPQRAAQTSGASVQRSPPPEAAVSLPQIAFELHDSGDRTDASRRQLRECPATELPGPAVGRTASLESSPSRRKRRGSYLETILSSTAFQMLCTLVIMANSVYMGINTNSQIKYALRNIGVGGESGGETTFIIEGSFLLFYILELLLKLWAWKLKFFFGPDNTWNAFDLILVVSGVLGYFKIAQDIMWMRVVRAIVRLVKTLRIFRVVRFFKDLRIIMISFVSSIQTFWWGMVTIMLMIYMVAIVILQGVAEFVSATPADEIEESVLEVVRESWGSLGKAILTQYMAVTGGGPWGKAISPLWLAGPLYYGIWLLYVALMAMAILKLLTGIFVQNARQAAAQDHAETIKVNIKSLFHDIDEDQSGHVSKEEFAACVHHPSAKSFFEGMGISTSDAEKLFHLIDEGGDNEVDIDEFILGCQKFSGPAKNIDMAMTMAKVHELHADFGAFISYVEDQFDRIGYRQGLPRLPRVVSVHEPTKMS